MSDRGGAPAPEPPVARLDALVHWAAARYGDAPFLSRAGEPPGAAWSFRTAADAARGFAARLAREGVRAGDRVAIQGENRPEWGLAYLAALEAGAVVVPLDVQLHEGDAGEILQASGVRFAIVSAGRREGLARAVAARGLEVSLLAMEDVARRDAVPGTNSGAARAAAAAADPRTAPAPVPAPATADSTHALAALLYTSGTTDRPKGVMLSHRNLLANVEAIVSAFRFDSRDRLLSVLPLHHAFECTVGFLGALRVGASVVYARSLKSSELREDLGASGATILLGVPLLYEKLLAAIERGVAAAPPWPRALSRGLLLLSRGVRRATGLRLGRALLAPLRARAGLGRMRMLVSGAAPLRPDTFWGFTDLGVLMLEGYGLTECSPVVCATRPERSFPGTVGWPLPGVRIRITDPDENAEGEIAVHGPNLMLGYFDQPLATAEVLRDGWFMTGDLGRIPPDGRLVLTGRRKNLIVTAAGKKIYPEEVEARIARSKWVKEVAVVAGHGAHGAREEVHAHVVPDLEAIAVHARERGRDPDDGFVRELLEREVGSLGRDLAPFKRVRKVIVRTGDLPRTSTGKVKRDALG